MRCKLCPHQFEDDRDLGVEFLLPAAGDLDEVLVDGIADEALARLAPCARGPFSAEPGQVEFERLASLRLDERYGMAEFHALGVQGCRDESRGVPCPYTLLDLGVQAIERLHREFIWLRDPEVEAREPGEA